MSLFELVAPIEPIVEAPPIRERDEAKIRLLEARKTEAKRRVWAKDPVRWVKERLRDALWFKQRDVLESVRDHRRTAVPSCHQTGKSWSAAAIVCWWLDTSPAGEAFVVTSAPTAPQVRAILWREIGRAHTRGGLRGRLNQVEWHMDVGGKEELVAFGRKPDEYDPTAFQGIHAPRVLVVFDEACGINGPLWEAADSLIANDDSKFLIIGNPDDPRSEFARLCRPGSGWNVVPISAFDSPNFTGEAMPRKALRQLIGRTYVEEKRRKWASTWRWVDADGADSTPELGVRCVPPEGEAAAMSNPIWASKILGVFPENPEAGALILPSWILAAQNRTLVPKAGDPHRLSLDVGAGGDESTFGERKGPVFRVLSEDRNPDTMQTCGKAIALLERTKAEKLLVDEIGVGKGVLDRAVEMKKPAFGVNAGEKAIDEEHYLNLRAELWWALRERFERGEIDIDPADDDLAGELAEIRYKRTSSGKIQVESKQDMRARGVPSPNRADSLMMSLYEPPEDAAQEGTW